MDEILRATLERKALLLAHDKMRQFMAPLRDGLSPHDGDMEQLFVSMMMAFYHQGAIDAFDVQLSRRSDR